MIQSGLGWLISFLLGDLIGPGLAVTGLMALALVCAVRGWKFAAYGAVVAALLLGAFLAGSQGSKQQCDARVQKIYDDLKTQEEAEEQRQREANEQIRKLRDENFRLTVREVETRKIKNEPIIKEIVRTQTIEKCSSAQWSDTELDRVRDSLRSRRNTTQD